MCAYCTSPSLVGTMREYASYGHRSCPYLRCNDPIDDDLPPCVESINGLDRGDGSHVCVMRGYTIAGTTHAVHSRCAANVDGQHVEPNRRTTALEQNVPYRQFTRSIQMVSVNEP